MLDHIDPLLFEKAGIVDRGFAKGLEGERPSYRYQLIYGGLIRLGGLGL